VSFGGMLADLVVSVDGVPQRGEDVLASDFRQTVGGGFAVMAAAARFKMATALAGVLGDDAFAETARRALREEGVELLLPVPREGGSGVCLVLVDAEGERTMVTVQGVESGMRPEDLSAISLEPDDVVYLSGYELLYPHGQLVVDWVVEARPASLIFDPGPLIADIEPERLETILAATTWLSLNAAEASALTGVANPSAAATAAMRRLGDDDLGRGQGVVVRTGPQGCVVLERGGTPVSVPGFATEAVDTTGAGDTHVGAFVAGLARGLDPVEACRWANASAAHVVASRGQVSPPGVAEVLRILGAPTSSW
jgi:sugar/nucleoside kinase (ribokinase family)